MDQAFVEKLARSMCIAARTDPDALVEPDFAAPGYSSIEPAGERVPAWQRFRSAAENAWRLRSRFLPVAEADFRRSPAPRPIRAQPDERRLTRRRIDLC
jgi:hypothetical protein